MGRTFGFITLLTVVASGLYLYTKETKMVTPGGTNPTTAIDVTAVRNDLLAMANAERRYWATHAKYASFDELRTNGDIHIPSRPTYTYSAESGDTSFKIIATYSGPDPNAPKRIIVDETMRLRTE